MHEKIFNIASHSRNANQNPTEIAPHSAQYGYHQEMNNGKDRQGYGEKRTLIHC